MSDPLNSAARHDHSAPISVEFHKVPSRLPYPPTVRRFAEVIARAEPPSESKVVEVLEAVATDFRQGEASILDLINRALAGPGMSREQLLVLRARMRRYSLEVDALANLAHALADDLRRCG
ncbi:MAG: hypothetical protein IPJ65_29315 [Archangiaceae bacterium]|nr:hypothetical protein [Archangiaceae bacterium]